MVKKEAKHVFETETLILPAIRMVLTETGQHIQPNSKNSACRKQKQPNQKTVLRIIDALNKEE